MERGGRKERGRKEEEEREAKRLERERKYKELVDARKAEASEYKETTNRAYLTSGIRRSRPTRTGDDDDIDNDDDN